MIVPVTEEPRGLHHIVSAACAAVVSGKQAHEYLRLRLAAKR